MTINNEEFLEWKSQLERFTAHVRSELDYRPMSKRATPDELAMDADLRDRLASDLRRFEFAFLHRSPDEADTVFDDLNESLEKLLSHRVAIGAYLHIDTAAAMSEKLFLDFLAKAQEILPQEQFRHFAKDVATRMKDSPLLDDDKLRTVNEVAQKLFEAAAKDDASG